jgi:hypothetical protein
MKKFGCGQRLRYATVLTRVRVKVLQTSVSQIGIGLCQSDRVAKDG